MGPLYYITFGAYLYLTFYDGGHVRLNHRWRASELQKWSIQYDKSLGANKICIGKDGSCIAVASGRNASDMELLVTEPFNSKNPNNYWVINTNNSIRLQSNTKFFWNFQHGFGDWEPLQINIINGLTNAKPNSNFQIIPAN